MTPYQQLVSAALRIAWLLEWEGAAVADVELPYFNIVVIAKGERVDGSAWDRLNHYWDLVMESYD